MTEAIEKIADKIIRRLSDDISDRRGIKHEWELIDREVMEGELEPTWRKIIITELNIAGYRLPSTAREALSDEELNKAYDGAFDKPMDFDHKPTADELHTIRLRAVSQATVKGE